MKIEFGFPQTLIKGYHYNTDTFPTKFKSYDECTEEQKRIINERKQKVEAFRKKIEQSKSTKYDKEGLISIPIYKDGRMDETLGWNNRTQSVEEGLKEATDFLTLQMTQRQLAQAGLLPKDFAWRKKRRTKITTTDIAEADKEQALTTKEIGEVRSLIDKIKEFFKGKGEK